MAIDPDPQVFRGGNLYLGTVAVPTSTNVSCYANALEITSNTEEIDLGTMCLPGSTEQGRTTYSAVASLLWSPGLYALLLPIVGVPIVVRFVPFSLAEGGGPTYYVSFDSRIAAVPWGRFEIGQRVEVDLPLAVLSTPVWVQP